MVVPCGVRPDGNSGSIRSKAEAVGAAEEEAEAVAFVVAPGTLVSAFIFVVVGEKGNTEAVSLAICDFALEAGAVGVGHRAVRRLESRLEATRGPHRRPVLPVVYYLCPGITLCLRS